LFFKLFLTADREARDNIVKRFAPQLPVRNQLASEFIQSGKKL
jgi:hypothetical protein